STYSVISTEITLNLIFLDFSCCLCLLLCAETVIYAMEQLDEIDLKLLKILGDDSSHTIKELAAKVNLTPSPVVQRVKRLETSGYIKKYIALLDPEKFNQGFIVFCNIRLKQHDRKVGHSFVKDILKIEEVVECYNISGDYDFF